MNIQRFDKLYTMSMDDFDALGDDTDNLNFVFQGSSNWDMYFSNVDKNDNVDEINNVFLLSFKDKSQFEKTLTSMSKDNVIDYSTEHYMENGINECYILTNIIDTKRKVKIKKLQPENFEQECTTVWSFARRGNWATHNSKYRGNWAPEVVRNLIVRYSKENDYILDPMIGGGTTAIECKLLNRNLLALDINPNAIEITRNALKFESEFDSKIELRLNDSRELGMLKNESIDFVLNHPPYADIINYSEKQIPQDLSNIHDLEKFCDEMEKVASELHRVLKQNKFCAILIGDTRRNKMYQSLAFMVMQRFLRVGFALKEDIIKQQHNCKATGFWVNKSKEANFLLIMHEHLFVFQKLDKL